MSDSEPSAHARRSPPSDPFQDVLEHPEYDFPPASDPRSPYPYPNRHTRLSRALQSTSDLVNELGGSASVLSERITQAAGDNRPRRHSLIEDEDLPYHVENPSNLLSSTRDSRSIPQRRSVGTYTGSSLSPRGGNVSLEPGRSINFTRSRRHLLRNGVSTEEQRQSPPNLSLSPFQRSVGDSGPVEQWPANEFSRRRFLSDAEEDAMAELSNEPRRPMKRRRMTGRPTINWLARPPISYGHYGQVEPGGLKMELISCDGGEMVDHRSPQVYLGYQNVLKLDRSVYCSSHERVNMLMRHADTTPFCIDKLHIIAPENGFDAPVNQGVVYIAMTLDDLKKYQDRPLHAQLSDKNPLRHPSQLMSRRLNAMRASERLSLSEALRDPEIAAFYYNQSGSTLTERPPQSDADESTQTSARDPMRTRWDEREDNETPLMPHNAATYHSFNEVLRGDDETAPEVIEYRNHRQHARTRLRPGLLTDPYHPMMAPQLGSTGDEMSRRVDQSSQTESSQNIRPPGPLAGSKDQEVRMLPYQDPNVTFVPFFIEEGKHSVAIKFEPQISGRFILLKLSAEMGKGNVDVQSIVVSGFAGPRFFPAKEFR